MQKVKVTLPFYIVFKDTYFSKKKPKLITKKYNSRISHNKEGYFDLEILKGRVHSHHLRFSIAEVFNRTKVLEVKY